MYGPSLDNTSFDQAILFPTAANKKPEPASLELVELEILLSLKIADGQDFESAVQATLECSGDEYLFSFPSEKFPIPCTEVACVRMRSNARGGCIYLYQEAPGEIIQIADASQLDEEFMQFAHSFIAVMEQMRDIFSSKQAH